MDQVMPRRGMYYQGAGNANQPLYAYEHVKDKLPEPILPERGHWLGCYRYALILAFKNAKTPAHGSGFISNYVDAAFNEDFFLWDTVFITMFADMFRPFLPGVEALDNFYVKQLPSGEIPREMVRETGGDLSFWINEKGLPLHSYFHNHYGFRGLFKSAPPKIDEMYFPDLKREQPITSAYTLDNLNHPLLAWGELTSFEQIGDASRLAAVLPPLVKQYAAMKALLRHANGLYVTDWASMDNSPRNAYLGCGVDISCEMAMFANHLITLLDITEAAELRAPNNALRKGLERDYAELREVINALMWDEETGFYYDLTPDGKRAPVKTAAAFWALASGIASKKQARRLKGWLEDRASFNRTHRVPVCAADEPGYAPLGGYWRGSVWAPVNTMVLYGLERYGYDALAREIALNHLDAVSRVWEQTGTIWENYPPDSIGKADADKGEFVGWSGIGPLRYLLRYAVGLKPDAPNGALLWSLDYKLLRKGPVGCKRFGFGGITCDLLAYIDEGRVAVEARSDKPFTLIVSVGGAAVQVKIIPENGTTVIAFMAELSRYKPIQPRI